MNSRVPRQDKRERLHAYGLAPEIQNDILNNMTKMMSEIRVIGRNTLLPFQKGIILYNMFKNLCLKSKTLISQASFNQITLYKCYISN